MYFLLMHLLLNCLSRQPQCLQGLMSHNVAGTRHPQDQGQILYFLDDVSPLIPLDVATPNFVGVYVT